MKNKIFKNRFFYTIVVFGLLCFFIPKAYAAQTKPPTTISWYVYVTGGESDQTLYNWMYNTGYQTGQTDLSLPGTQYSLVILDFGQPWQSGNANGTWSFNATYGRFLSKSVIQEAVKQFALGYYYGTGSDVQSQLRAVVGTNNYGPYTTYGHGQSWAQLVKDIGAWLAGNSVKSQVTVRGGDDVETGYSSSNTAVSWVNGYASAWNAPYYVYNYGDAGGCPQSGTTATPGPCNNGWSQDGVEYVSWGASPAYPFPQIYATSGANAKQWQQIALYSRLAYNSGMVILGPLSQSQACVQKGGCVGTDNTPSQAWVQLWDQLNGDARTAQGLSWSTDIKWRK